MVTDTEPDHRALAIAANNETWELLSAETLDDERVQELLERAYASAYHWRRAASSGGPEQARAAWLLSRAHAVAGAMGSDGVSCHAALASHHARRCAAMTAAADGVVDFDRVYANEALARAAAMSGDHDQAAQHLAAARSVEVADPEDRAIVEADIAAGPWFGYAVDV